MRTTTPKVALLALLLVLAGCGGGGSTTTAPAPTLADEPTRTTTATETPTATPEAGDSLAGFGPRTDPGRRFLELAEGNGVPVRAAFTRNGTFNVVYEVDAESSGERGFLVAQAYATAVNETWTGDGGWNATAMEATAVSAQGVPVTTYRMPAYWGHRVRTSEVYGEPNLGRDLDDATSEVTANGSLVGVTETTAQFGRGLQATQNGTVAGVTRRGDTAFVTLETRTDDRTVLERRVGRVTTVYGAFLDRGWNVSRVEIEVRRPDGDVYGWYHVRESWARDAYTNRVSLPYEFVLDTFYGENDGLDGARATGD